MLQRFSFVNFSGGSYHISGVFDTIETEFAGQQPLEELVENQALSIDLKEAVMACLTGRESRPWTIGELVERLGALGLSCSRASDTGALAELEVELQLCAWAPWKLLERGTEWIWPPNQSF
jgi:hypothetical protein